MANLSQLDRMIEGTISILLPGIKYISLYGDDHKVQYDSKKECFEIIITTPAQTTSLPVYKTKISNTWHLSTQQSVPCVQEATY